MNCPLRFARASRGQRRPFRASLASQPILILAALIKPCHLLGVLTKASFIPSPSSPACPPRGWVPSSPFFSSGGLSHHRAMIASSCSSASSKKNAILMIDFALDVQRDQSSHPRAPSIRPVCWLPDPSCVTTAAAAPRRPPLALGSGVGASCGVRSASPIVGGLCIPNPHPVQYSCVYLYMRRFRN